MASFCSVSDKSVAALYQLVVRLMIENSDITLPAINKNIYDIIYENTKNKEQALTYVNLVPSIILMSDDLYITGQIVEDNPNMTIDEVIDTNGRFLTATIEDMTQELGVSLDIVEEIPPIIVEGPKINVEEEVVSFDAQIKALENERDEKLRKLEEEKAEILKELEFIQESKKNKKDTLDITKEEKAFIETSIPAVIEEVATEEEKTIIEQVAEENKREDQTTEQFVAEQVENEIQGKQSEVKGEETKVSVFRNIIRKIAKFLVGLSLIWMFTKTTGPLSDFLNRNNIVTREKTAFVMDLAKINYSITEQSFTESQKDLLVSIIKKAESDGREYVTYNDYPSGYDGVQFDKTSPNTKLDDNSDETVVKRTIGQFEFKKNDNLYVISDKYNFNDAGTKSFGETFNYVLDGLSDTTLNGYGKIRRVATLLGSKEGKGSDIRIEIEDKSTPIGTAVAASFLLLGSIRRKRENGEDVTDEDIEALKRRLNEIENEIKETKEFYENKIKDLKDSSKDTIYGRLTEEEIKLFRLKDTRVEELLDYQESLSTGPSNLNILDSVIDDARKDGKFVFDTVFPREIESDGDKRSTGKFDKNGHLLLKTLKDKKLLRQHNYLNNAKIDEHKIELQLVTDKNNNWFYQRDDVAPKIVAVITDLDGNILNFNDEGVTDDNGSPIAFEYEYNYYKPENLSRTRKSIMTGQSDKALKNGFGKNNPLDVLVDILNSGQKITGSIASVMEGQMSNLKSTNTPSYSQEENMRTFGELIADGFEEQKPFVRLSGFYLEYINSDQRVKIGQPYIYDEDSQTYISLIGKKLKDLTLNGQRIFDNKNTVLYKIIQALEMNGKVGYDNPTLNGEVIFSNEMIENLPQIYKFLKDLLYSRNFQIKLSDNMRNIEMKRGSSANSIWDAKINFVNNKNPYSDVIYIPFSFDSETGAMGEIDYKDFMYENFLTGAVKAKIDKDKPAKFEKLNKRMVLALDMDINEMLAIKPLKMSQPNLSLSFLMDEEIGNVKTKKEHKKLKDDFEDIQNLIKCLWS